MEPMLACGWLVVAKDKDPGKYNLELTLLESTHSPGLMAKLFYDKDQRIVCESVATLAEAIESLEKKV